MKEAGPAARDTSEGTRVAQGAAGASRAGDAALSAAGVSHDAGHTMHLSPCPGSEERWG